MNLSIEYFLLLLLGFLACVFSKNRILCCMFITSIVVLAVFRDVNVGTDTLGYEDDFNLIHEIDTAKKIIYHSFELGFLWLIVLYKSIFGNHYLSFVSLIWILFFLSIYKFAKDNHVNKSLFFFLFVLYGYFFYSMNAIRQTMAIAFIYLMVPLLHKKKYIKFGVAVIIISYLFHRSELLALSFIPIHYFTKKYKNSRKKYILFFVVVSLITSFFCGTLLSSLALKLIDLIPNVSIYENYVVGTMDKGFFMVLLYNIFAIYIYYSKPSKKYSFEWNIFLFSIIIYNVVTAFSVYAFRLYYVCNFMQILLLAQMVSDKETRHYRLFVFVVFILGLVLFVWRYGVNNIEGVNPYQFRTLL